MISIPVLFLTSLALIAGCTKKDSSGVTQPETAGATASAPGSVTELEILDQKVGKGATAVAGKLVTVHYVGRLSDGKQFDSSVDKNSPFKFTLGAGQVIPGWDRGLQGMKVGGKRKLTIPPHLGYGQRGAGQMIPPNSTLVFDVELLKVE